jgi:hypothetical protein
MKITQILLSLLIIIVTVSFPSTLAATGLKAKIQLAILLDSSNSMDGLIDQTKTQLWQIVNHLTKVSKNGQKPDLQIALYHYGNDSLPAAEGHIRQLTRFTPELDLISQKLFEIRTNGGQEYAGWVIDSAVKQLEWSKSPEDFRAIFIAGNEPFDQGPMLWSDAVKKANQKDIIINTIYCGSSESYERNLWVQGAILGKGNNFNINQNRVVVNISTPYDQEIANWNQKLNETYIPYGNEGMVGFSRQSAEDDNALDEGVLSVRGAAKVSDYYRNSSWDLIDALTDGIVKLEDINNNDLPEIMRSMSLSDKLAYVTEKKATREQVRQIIADLYAKRTAYIEQERGKNIPRDTVDYVIIEALNRQLADKGFVVKQ